MENLASGKTEDGTSSLNEKEEEEALEMWRSRELKILYSLVNTAVLQKVQKLLLFLTHQATAE